jgi:hypothetical protein
MSAAPIIDDSVNLIHNERPRCAQYAPTRLGCEQEIQGLRRRNEDVRRLFDQRLPLRGSCITGANFGAHIDRATICLLSQRANPDERLLKIFPDIVAQRFKRRHVYDLRFIG